MQEPPTPVIVQWLRVIRLALHLGHGLLTAALILQRLSPEQQQHRILGWSSKLLRILGIQTKVYGAIPPADLRGSLFVANHVSWIDIWALKQLRPMQFIAKAEIRHWPMIGWLAHQVGTLFIERERRHDTGRMVRVAEQALSSGECLCFFPEGTTTDGSRLLPFKPSLLQAAINAETAVIPLAIRYPKADGGINTAIAYHGDVTMLESFREVLRQRTTLVELHFGTPIAAAGMERRALAHQARNAISSLLGPAVHMAPGTGDDPPAAPH